MGKELYIINPETKIALLQVLAKHHKRNVMNVYYKLFNKITSIKNKLVTASKKNSPTATTEELLELMAQTYGLECPYCDKQIMFNNFHIDHKTPISKGGAHTIDNLQFICSACNLRKGNLTDEDYRALLNAIAGLNEEIKRYVMTKLTMIFRGGYNDKKKDKK